MLQQTRVDRVVPRFIAFLTEFPDFESLAAADEESVLRAWSGLGYYRRARLLHRLACTVVDLEGALPRDRKALEALPGIGPYTSAAVASLAFGLPEPVLDGNVLRVASRVLALDDDPRSAKAARIIRSWAASLMEGRPPGAINEALMELGATVCTSAGPICSGCPMHRICAARVGGRPENYPAPRRTRSAEEHRWVVACCVRPDGRWLLRRVTDGPILRGLWLPPFADLPSGGDPAAAARALLPIEARLARVLPTVRHSITHRRIKAVPVRLETSDVRPADSIWRWADPQDPGMPTSSLFCKLVAAETE